VRFASFLTIAMLLFVPRIASAELMVNLIFDDVVNNTNVGFDDPSQGQARRDTLGSVMTYVSQQLSSSYSATIDIQIQESQVDGNGFLASASPFYFTGPDGFYNGFVYDHANTGSDPSGSVPDATARFDFGYDWHTGNAPTPSNQFDLFSTALHELTHAMGFTAQVGETGESRVGNSGNPGVFGVFATFLELGDGTDLFDQTTGTFLGTPSDLVSDDVFFNGPNAVAANGGDPVKIYAPDPFRTGSSISHFDPIFTDVVMNPSSGQGDMSREWTALDRGVLADIGWVFETQVAQVPEPSTFILFGLGTAVLAVPSLRRRS